MSDTSSARQYLRACSLIVADESGNGIELAGPTQDNVLRIRFQTTYQVTSTPATLNARIYNLSKDTTNSIIQLANKNPPTINAIPFPSSAKVTLKAGYRENFGLIFTGQIYQIRVGKENNTDSFLDLFAADGDLAHNYSNANYTFASGYKAEDVWNHLGNTMKSFGVTTGKPPQGLDPNASPRGRVVFGPTKNVLNDMSNSYDFTWNIREMQLFGLRRFTFDPGSKIVVNSLTGMIGVPTQTQQGIQVTSLLNPAIRWGTHVLLNNADITRLLFTGQGLVVPTQANVNAAAQPPTPPLNINGTNITKPEDIFTDADGEYVVLWVEHFGDTRGIEWYSKFSCLTIDPSTQALPSNLTQIQAPPPFGRPS